MWFKNDYRRIFMDMHLTDDKPDVYLSKLDVDEFVGALKECGATSVVVKGKSHVGLHYWKCKTGRMHEGLRRRDLDYLGEMVEKCHAAGINVMTYLSQNFDNYAYDEHPDWRIVKPGGAHYRDDGTRYGIVCLNNPEYRAYVKEILTEMAENYNFDGIFLDMPHWKAYCQCDACKKRCREELGIDVPTAPDWDNPDWIRFFEARNRWLTEFMMENTAAVKAVRPEISVEHNMSTMAYHFNYGNCEAQADASDYMGGDYYAGYAEQMFVCKWYNSLTKNKPFCYITSRCDPGLRTHTAARTKDDLLIHSMNALVHNGAFSICDAMNPDGTFAKELYSGRIKELFTETAPYEKYVSGDLISDAAVLFPIDRKANDNFFQSPMFTAGVLRLYNVPYNVIGCRNIKDLPDKVLCISDAYHLSDEVCRDIEAYVEKGGKLFITGKLPKPLEKLCGVTVKAKSQYDYCYLRPTEDSRELFGVYNEKSPYPIQARALEAELSSPDAKAIACLTYPYTRPYDREFAAIHSNPPGIDTEIPAIVRTPYGKGEVIWICAPAELTRAMDCREVIYNLIKSLCGEFYSGGYAPEFCEILHWRKDGKRYFSVINEQPITPCYPISDITVTIRAKVKNVTLLTPSETPLTWEYKDGVTTVHLPKLQVFHIAEYEIEE